MHDFVCSCSSLEPSELTAAILLLNSDGVGAMKRFLILVDDTFEMRAYSHEQNFFPNYTFPRYRVIQQSHEQYRATYSDLSNCERAISDAQSYLQYKINRFKDKYPDRECRISPRVEGVFSSLLGSCRERTGKCKAQNYETLLVSIMKGLTGEAIEFRKLSGFIQSEQGLIHGFGALRSLYMGMKDGEKIEFLRKGSIAIKCATGVHRIQALRRTEKGLYASCVSGSSVEFLLSLSENSVFVDGGEVDVVSIKFEGMAINNYLLEIANLVHLGWYSLIPEHSQKNEKGTILELVSPISNVEQRRVSRYFGGGGIRLSPSGYTLLDYHHPAVMDLIGVLLGEAIDDPLRLLDWVNLSENMPIAREKGTKNSRQIRTYVNKTLTEEWMVDREFPKIVPEAIGVFELGVAMRQLMRELNQLRRFIVIGQKADWIDISLSGAVSVDEKQEALDLYGLVHTTEKILSRSTNWRREMCESFLEQQVLNEFTAYNSEYLSKMNYEEHSQSWVSFNHPNLRLLISRYERFIRLELFEYYSLVYCLLNTLLKATPLNILIAFRRDELPKVVESLLVSRGQRTSIIHNGALSWKTIQ